MHSYDNQNDASSSTVGPDLSILPKKMCYLWSREHYLLLLWCLTRDMRLRNSNFPPCHRCGLILLLNQRNSHIFICLLLAGDICVNPGPVGFTRPVKSQTQHRYLQDTFSNCLVVNARILKSLHKLNDKQVCNLSLFQELVYTEDSYLVWVPETWLNKDIENTEILPSGYSIDRKDHIGKL